MGIASSWLSFGRVLPLATHLQHIRAPRMMESGERLPLAAPSPGPIVRHEPGDAAPLTPSLAQPLCSLANSCVGFPLCNHDDPVGQEPGGGTWSNGCLPTSSSQLC
ncbi:hypothetical protein DPEC_G00269480 [Dallia pectoralis]|uniref:Uncharacterized protein n=1 Tax=Dallia pectoralis TaxID=75939 RepID=A0ACC2FP22_DALPE|nr:hypothetical protein DPEC_G00269480 [Dallia pectoralis]